MVDDFFSLFSAWGFYSVIVEPLLISSDGSCALGCVFLFLFPFYISFVLEHMEFTLVETILYDAVMLWLCGYALSSRHLSVPAKTCCVFLLGAVLCWSGLATLLQIPVDEHTGRESWALPEISARA